MSGSSSASFLQTSMREAAIATLATLVGAIILSRAVRDGDPDLSDETLRAAYVDRKGRSAET